MTEPVRSGEQNVTGVWHGLYTYENGGSTSFVATLIESGGSLSGTTHELSTSGASIATVLFASLTGSRHDSAVTFLKTYDRPDALHQRPVAYEGTLNGEGTEIEGRWTIRKNRSGKFLMVRSPGQTAKAERKVSERVR
jgi:hypothetical protein